MPLALPLPLRLLLLRLLRLLLRLLRLLRFLCCPQPFLLTPPRLRYRRVDRRVDYRACHGARLSPRPLCRRRGRRRRTPRGGGLAAARLARLAPPTVRVCVKS